jgi:hypothetical protein
MTFKDFYREKSNLLLESKQNILNLGYPQVIVNVIFDEFKRNAFTIARWFKECIAKDTDNKDWWNQYYNNPLAWRSDNEFNDLIKVYNALNVSYDEYKNVATKLQFPIKNMQSESALYSYKKELYEQIKDDFLNNKQFRAYTLFEDIINGSLTDINPYKNLNFWDALKKYNVKKLFDDKEPIKHYSNGYKWIDAGRKCELIASQMSNCGSCGVTSSDSNATMLVLMDSNNKPHVMVTYSKSNNSVSYPEGCASTAPKDEYHEYILDLIKFLNANLKTDTSKSLLLVLKHKFINHETKIKEFYSDSLHKIFILKIDGQIYYSNGYYVISKNDLYKIKNTMELNDKNLIDTIKFALNMNNRREIVHYLPSIKIIEV